MKLFETWVYLGGAAVVLILLAAVILTMGIQTVMVPHAVAVLIIIPWMILTGFRNLAKMRIEKLNKEGEK